MPKIMLAQSNKAYQSGQSSSMNVESNLELRIRFVKETVSLAQWGQKNFHFTIYHPPPPPPPQAKQAKILAAGRIEEDLF